MSIVPDVPPPVLSTRTLSAVICKGVAEISLTLREALFWNTSVPPVVLTVTELPDGKALAAPGLPIVCPPAPKVIVLPTAVCRFTLRTLGVVALTLFCISPPPLTVKLLFVDMILILAPLLCNLPALLNVQPVLVALLINKFMSLSLVTV